MDPLIADLACHLRVADKDILSVKDHEHGHDVLLADGCHILVSPHGDFLLNHHRQTRKLPHWDEHSHKFDKKPEPDPEPEPESKEIHVPETGSSDAMLKWVGDRVDRAEAALDQERRRPKPRLALIKQLERIVDG